MQTPTPSLRRNRPRIIILGGGFAGAYCAQSLQHTLRGIDADVLLIDRNNYFAFYPLLVEAGTGALEPRHAVVPLRQFLGRGTRLRVAEVSAIDPDEKRVHYCMIGESRERCAEYDHLVIAMGSVTNMPPVPGLKEHAFELKSLSDSVSLRDRAIHMLERANTTRDPEIRRALLHFVVVGGSYSGVEAAGEFNQYLREATGHYRNLSERDIRVTIVDRNARLLPPLPESLARYATKELERAGVVIRLNESIDEVHHDHVVYRSGESEGAGTVVWCAGIAQSPFLKDTSFHKDERGYLLAEKDFRLKGRPDVWGIGDCTVNITPKGEVYAATAQNAVRMGKHLARNLRCAIDRKATSNFKFKPLGSLAPLGRGKAVADVFGVRLRGFPAWWMWRTVYLMKMPGFGRKFRVALDWTMGLFSSRDFVELGLTGRRAVVATPPTDDQRESGLEASVPDCKHGDDLAQVGSAAEK